MRVAWMGAGWLTRGRLGAALVDARRAAAGEVAHLDQVADLIGEPEAAPAGGHEVGKLAAGERVPHQPAVVDLADQRSLPPPEAQDPASAAVYHAVGGHLVDSEHEIFGALS